MRIEDVPSPPKAGQQTIIGVDNLDMETVVRPAPVVASALPTDDAATRPSAATRLRRPDAESRLGGPAPLARSSLRPMPAERSRSRLPMLALGGLAAIGLIAVVLGVLILPVAYTQTDGFTRFDAFTGRAEAPAPEVAPAPAPAPQPAPPGDVEAAGVGEGTALADGEPDAEAPTPTPTPEPAKEATPAPRVERTPEPEPASTLPPVDIQGLWLGSIQPSSSSFKLVVLEQKGGDMKGTVDLQDDEGLMQQFEVQGTIDGNGVLTFRGNGKTFTGRVDLATHARANGTCSLRPGGKGFEWSAVHSN
ncbi:MAG: hypothetical protein R3F59_03475 [Myxococcota bacterium]